MCRVSLKFLTQQCMKWYVKDKHKKHIVLAAHSISAGTLKGNGVAEKSSSAQKCQALNPKYCKSQLYASHVASIIVVWCRCLPLPLWPLLKDGPQASRREREKESNKKEKWGTGSFCRKHKVSQCRSKKKRWERLKVVMRRSIETCSSWCDRRELVCSSHSAKQAASQFDVE